MKLRTIAGCMALAGAAFWIYSIEPDPGIDPFVSASVSKVAHGEFTIANLETKQVCLASRGKAEIGRSRPFNAEKGCDNVWPGLGEARNWTENEDGSVMLTTERGESIVTLSAGDGVDYEALDPENALLTLTFVD